MFNPDNIPQKLKTLPNWVVWKEGKIPYSPKSGKPARAGDPSTWATWDEAYTAYVIDEGYLGLGFELNSNGVVVVDLDKCRDPQTGIVHPDAQKIVESLGSYTEISVSGYGLHIFVEGDIPRAGRRSNTAFSFGIEMYKSGRYIIMTGDIYEI